MRVLRVLATVILWVLATLVLWPLRLTALTVARTLPLWIAPERAQRWLVDHRRYIVRDDWGCVVHCRFVWRPLAVNLVFHTTTPGGQRSLNGLVTRSPIEVYLSRCASPFPISAVASQQAA